MSSFLARRAFAAPQFARTFSSTPARPFAKISIIGSLGNTPEIQATSTGRELMRYSVASSHRSKGETKTSWFRITNFGIDGARREFFQSLPKGTLVYVEGEVTMDKFVDNEGKTKTSFNIVQQRMEVLRRPTQSNEELLEEGE